ncbi:MAG: 5'-nucleotidase, lipoprotein e(P4) family [Fidelibacterota bacterium]|nr:MAG: 5'-nucleotidase, lipoprotein e(P4) family [Candidatus Neomarinimicrobiota bacterium]
MQPYTASHSPGRWWGVGLVLLLIGACARQPDTPAAHELLNATLWIQHSAEYRAIGLQAYHLARTNLDRALADPTWTAALEQTDRYSSLPPAVIIDVDETALDNSPNEARLIRDRATFTYDTWDIWVEEARARPVPGALEFCQYAADKGVTVFYVTNRQDHLREATRRNLEQLGFPLDEHRETILTRGDNSDKGPRRAALAKDYRILLLIGDDARDFSSDFVGASLPERNELPAKYASWWGRKWIVLPNPLYGDWEKVIFGADGYALDRNKRLKRKLEALRYE